jgi:polysaccharide pyruvyl transferase WcaK-like protein
MRFLYLGQTSMGNRGCEALVRSNSALIRHQFPGATFLCPSQDAARDAAQWPDHVACGVEFVEAPPLSQALLWWNRLRRLPLLGQMPLPRRGLGGFVGDMAARCDAVLMTGGDIISLDYSEFSLYHWAGLVEAFARAGKPVHLIGASLGPFTKSPGVEQQMRKHLTAYTSVTVRETPSLAYAEKLGRGDAILVTDPAFTLKPQSWDMPPLATGEGGILGLNFSPLVRETRGSEQSKQAFDDDIVRFIASVIERTDMSVMLIPHVFPLDGGEGNSDLAYMRGLLSRLPAGDRVMLLDGQPNTCQLKYAIGRCRFFMGARTHATVAALSQSVPTCSIAYSVKALGINQDLIGDTRYVLPTPDVSFDTLWAHLDLLKADETAYRALLDRRIPEWRVNAALAIPELGKGLPTR